MRLADTCSCTGKHDVHSLLPPVSQLLIAGFPLQVNLRGSVSSQYLTAILMAAPLAEGEGAIDIVCEDLISQPYVEMTINLMESFGAKVRENLSCGQTSTSCTSPARVGGRAGSYLVTPLLPPSKCAKWRLGLGSGGKAEWTESPSNTVRPDIQIQGAHLCGRRRIICLVLARR